MTTYLPVFTSPEGQAQVLGAYHRVLDHWPVPYTELDIPTSIGNTHVIASGPVDAVPLVLMHALFATAMSWHRNVGAFSEQYRTYAVDMMGEANRSRPTCRVRTLDEMARWFAELLDELDIAKTDLIGNSYGAFMSAYFAMRLPGRVRRLVLIGPAATFQPMRPFYWHMFIPKMAQLFFPRLPGHERRLRHSVDWMHAGLQPDPLWEPLFYQALLHGAMTTQILPRTFSADELRQIAAPALLVIGEQERIYPPQQVIRSAQRLMPNIQVSLIPDAHHISALAQPAAVNRAVLEFLQGPTDAASQTRARDLAAAAAK